MIHIKDLGLEYAPKFILIQTARHEHSGSNENISFLLTAIDNSFVKNSFKSAFVEVSKAFLYHCQTHLIKQQLIHLQLKKIYSDLLFHLIAISIEF